MLNCAARGSEGHGRMCFRAISYAPEPLSLTSASAPIPVGVAIATIVSSSCATPVVARVLTELRLAARSSCLAPESSPQDEVDDPEALRATGLSHQMQWTSRD